MQDQRAKDNPEKLAKLFKEFCQSTCFTTTLPTCESQLPEEYQVALNSAKQGA